MRLEAVAQDLRFAARTLGKAPGFTAVAVLTLALGIGANTAIFSLLDRVLLRLLPVRAAGELVLLTMRGDHYGNNSGRNALSYPMYRDFQDHNDVFSAMFCRFPTAANLTFGGRAERVEAELVSGTYFGVLGVGAAVGRLLGPEDDRVPDGHPLVVLSHAYWKARFAADPRVVGQTVIVNGRSMTVVGVAARGFQGVELGRAAEIFVPVMMQKQVLPGPRELLTDRRSRWVNAFGRLRPGVTRAEARAALQPFMHAMLEREVREPAFNRASAETRQAFLRCWIDVLPGGQGRATLQQQLAQPLWLLMATTGLVLLITCANLANLLLARATGRRREIAIRLAVGAGRPRIVRQLLTESLALSLLGAALGLGLAFWADKVLMALYLPADATGLDVSLTPDLRILLFTLAVTCLTAVAFGLVPALRSTRTDVSAALHDAGAAVTGGRQARVRKALVVAQVTLSLVLLVGAGLFLRSLANLRNLGPGFPITRLVGFGVDPTLGGYNQERTKAFYQQLQDALCAVPGVESCALAAVRILEGNEWDSSMTVEGGGPTARAQPYMNQIGPGYFATLGVPLVAGRDFTRQDSRQVRHDAGGLLQWVPAVAIINQSFARRHFAGRNPLGLHIGFGSDPGTPTDMEVVGVVKDIKYTSLRDEVPEQAFIPYQASPVQGGMTVYLRSALPLEALMPLVRAKVQELDPNMPLHDVRTTEAQIDNSLGSERMIAGLCSLFGALATLLAVIGLYGVMSYAVARRGREIGIRLALGAQRGTVIGMVMREVAVLVALGLALGVTLSLALTRVVASQLYGVPAHDPATLASAIVLLALIACLAGYLPARRASAVSPMLALRHD